MKAFIAGALACGLALPASAQVVSTGYQLYRECTDPSVALQNACHHYLIGLAEGFRAGNSISQPAPTYICYAEASSPTSGQLRLIFLKYADAHPGTLNQDQGAVALASMAVAFPCGGAK